MPPRHHRLRSASTSSSSSDSNSRSDGGSALSRSGDESGGRRGSSSDDDGAPSGDESDGEGGAGGGKHDRRPRRREQRSNTVLVAILIALLLLAIGAGVWFYLRQSGGSSSTSGSENAAEGHSGAAGGTAGIVGTAGRTAGTGGSAGTGGGGAGGSSKTTTGGSASSSHVTATGEAGEGKSTGKATASPSSSSGDPQPSSTSAASSPASTSSSNGCRKGVGYNDAKYTTNLDICWAYNWASTGGDGIRDGAMYVPMLWGTKSLDGWTDNANAAIKAGATHVLGFNEPDLPEQANLSPSAAAQLWLDQVEPLAGSAKLVSPGVTNGVKLDNGSALGVPWLQEFLAACSGCTIDAVALHWYDSAVNTAYFTKYLEESHSTLNKPIWLTEFMGTGTPDEQKTFLEFAVPWLEQQDWIERYAAFGDFLDNPVAEFIASDGGTLNDLGKAYSDAK